MNKTLSNLLAKAQRLESTIAATIEGAARRAAGEPSRAPLEIAHAIVEAVGREVEPSGRGRQAFPFNQVRVVVLAATAREKARLQVVFDGPPSLQERIVSHLDAAGCRVASLVVPVTFVGKRSSDWTAPEFDVTYARVAQHAAPSTPGTGLELTVIHGATAQAVYALEVGVLAIGRGEEVRDSRQHLVRTNTIVFTEGGGEINETISRRHAHIEQDASGSFRLFDDGSAQGTSIIRGGRGIPIARGTKGVRLQPGDEIVLGRGRLRVANRTGS